MNKPTAIDVLRELEWSYQRNNSMGCCPKCYEHQIHGHAPGCALDAVLNCPLHGWTPASVPPEKDGEYQVVQESAVGPRIWQREWWQGEWMTTSKITHWRPLPPLPDKMTEVK